MRLSDAMLKLQEFKDDMTPGGQEERHRIIRENSPGTWADTPWVEQRVSALLLFLGIDPEEMEAVATHVSNELTEQAVRLFADENGGVDANVVPAMMAYCIAGGYAEGVLAGVVKERFDHEDA